MIAYGLAGVMQAPSIENRGLEQIKPRLPYKDWKAITKRIYLDKFAGYPTAEMKRYYVQGMSPLQALDCAAKRRLSAPVKGSQP